MHSSLFCDEENCSKYKNVKCFNNKKASVRLLEFSFDFTQSHVSQFHSAYVVIIK